MDTTAAGIVRWSMSVLGGRYVTSHKYCLTANDDTQRNSLHDNPCTNENVEMIYVQSLRILRNDFVSPI